MSAVGFLFMSVIIVQLKLQDRIVIIKNANMPSLMGLVAIEMPYDAPLVILESALIHF